MTARQASAYLGIKPETLYAYVSRGLIASQPGKDPRSRLYARDEIRGLRRRSRQRQRPTEVARSALEWGAPVRDSALTLIDRQRFYYRGLDACELARNESFERVAALLWVGDLASGSTIFDQHIEPIEKEYRAFLLGLRDAHPSDPLHVLVRLLAAEDLAAADLRRSSVVRCGARLLKHMVSAAAVLYRPLRVGLAGALRWGWCRRREELEDVLSAALVLCADHELNVSTFTARCVASSGATPYDVVDAGLCALRGYRHGGHSDRVEALLLETGVAGVKRPLSRKRVRTLLGHRLQRGDTIPGFGHQLYPSGDPRFRVIESLLRERAGDSPTVESALIVAEEARAMLDLEPTIDFGLASLSAELGRSPGGAFVLFALGRSVGWIAHAIEEYAEAKLIRPRARYVGPASEGV